MSASLIGRLGSSVSGYPPLECRCHSRARASLRNRHQGPSIMGFEDEAEQSFSRPCRQTGGRYKQTYDLTSSIVPRGTSFHRSAELDFPSIGFDPARLSCCCDFSNRPFKVKHFQTIRRCSVDVTHGLVLLFGIGTKALPSWDSRTRRNNLLVGLAVRLSAGTSRHTISPHSSYREGHHSTARRNSTFLLLDLILLDSHAVATSLIGRLGS